MPIYKNRLPMDGDTEVRHYTSLNALISILTESQMRLTRIDTFPDPFEGSVPKQEYENQLPLFAGASARQMMMSGIAAHYPAMNLPQPEYHDMWEETTHRRKAKTRSTYASCWTAGEESEAMWLLYCKREIVQGVGVSLRTTLSKLEASVAIHDFFVSPIRYRYYHEGPVFDDELDPFMHKRRSFWHEQEVRILRFDEKQYSALTQKPTFGRPPPPVVEPPEHLSFEWSLKNTIDEITVSPNAPVDYEEKVKAEVNAIDPTLLDRVTLSVFNVRRYPAYF